MFGLCPLVYRRPPLGQFAASDRSGPSSSRVEPITIVRCFAHSPGPPARPRSSPIIPRPFPIHREPDAPRSALMCAYGCSSTGASPLSAISRVSPSPALYLFYLLLPLDTMKERWICRRYLFSIFCRLYNQYEREKQLLI